MLEPEQKFYCISVSGREQTMRVPLHIRVCKDPGGCFPLQSAHQLVSQRALQLTLIPNERTSIGELPPTSRIFLSTKRVRVSNLNLF